MISRKIVDKFLNAGINVIGLNKDNTPAEGYWARWQKEKRVSCDINSESLGIICGSISGGIEVIDIDLKYDITKTLYSRYTELVSDNDQNIISKLLIIKTKSNGYHWVYKCSEISGNKKLARRECTEDEKANRERFKVLIETRGEGGYIATFPSEGYEVIQGKFSEIPIITAEERDILHTCARTFDEEVNEVHIPKSTMNVSGKTPWDDYNEREDGLSELYSHGWTKVKTSGNRVFLKRSGDTKQKHSGNYLIDRKLFKSFSSSTVFEPGKAYPPFGVYACLNHNGDFSEAAKALYKLGYGEQKTVMTPTQQYEKKDINIDDISEHISDDIIDSDYLKKVREGTLELGLTTGISLWDEYFRFKRGKFCVIVGHSNVGKTTAILWTLTIPAVIHNWVGVIITKENSSGFTKRKLMEFYMCRPLEKMTNDEFEHAKRFVSEHFIIIKARGGFINDIPRVLKLSYKIAEERKIDFVCADPYSGFEKSPEPKENGHDYDYRMASEILDFTERTNVSMYLNAHTNTEARRKRDDDGNLICPWVDDVEGGGKWSNRADQGIVYHRKTKAEGLIRYITEFHMDKERESETGGKPTERDNPIQMLLEKNMCEFTINGVNPIRRWHEENGTIGFVKAETYNEALARVNQSLSPNVGFDEDEDDEAPF